LNGGRKPEYPERTHAYKGRTCKLHAERPQVGVAVIVYRKLVYSEKHFIGQGDMITFGLYISSAFR